MLAETERFVWLAGDTLYTGSRSKWKLWLNKIASSVDQQAKPWMLSHTRSCTCRMLEVTHTSPTSPSPQMDRSQSMSADYKTATGPFHFCLDKAAVLNGSPRSAFTLDQTASIWRNKAYSCCLFCFVFVFLAHPDQIICIIVHFKRLNHWNSWENDHNHQLLGALQQRLDDRFFVAQAWRRRWHWKVWLSMWPSSFCARVETGVENRKFILKRGRSGHHFRFLYVKALTLLAIAKLCSCGLDVFLPVGVLSTVQCTPVYFVLVLW